MLRGSPGTLSNFLFISLGTLFYLTYWTWSAYRGLTHGGFRDRLKSDRKLAWYFRALCVNAATVLALFVAVVL